MTPLAPVRVATRWFMSYVIIAVSMLMESASCIETSTCCPSPVLSRCTSAIIVPAAPSMPAQT